MTIKRKRELIGQIVGSTGFLILWLHTDFFIALSVWFMVLGMAIFWSEPS